MRELDDLLRRSGPRYYDRTGKPLTDVMEWAEWLAPENFEKNRRVASTTFYGTHISTVCLGLDHNWGDSGPPLIFETMAFGERVPEYTYRYATEKQAAAGHRKVVRLLALPHRIAAATSVLVVMVALVVMARAA